MKLFLLALLLGGCIAPLAEATPYNATPLCRQIDDAMAAKYAQCGGYYDRVECDKAVGPADQNPTQCLEDIRALPCDTYVKLPESCRGLFWWG